MRHRITKETIRFNSNYSTELTKAIDFESDGKWFLAAEKYLSIANKEKKNPTDYLEIVKLFAKAATCFEISIQNRDAALAYTEAASILYNHKINYLIAGELYNRSAFNFKIVREFFNAGDSYRRAAKAFAKVPQEIILTEDNIPPVPGGGRKYNVAARCFNAAAEAFIEGKELACARSSYWKAGLMKLKQGICYHGYVAFRKALVICIQFDQTHNREQLRKALSMSKEDRVNKIDPIKILEQAAYDGNYAHQKMNSGILDKAWIKQETDKLMISTFHEFYLEFIRVGNIKEAREYYILKRRRQQLKYFREKKYIPAIGFWLWDITCGYGENMKRWIVVCFLILLFFTFIYYVFNLIKPVNSSIDYLYFSVITLTSLGYGDIQPSGVLGKLVASGEIISGLLMFGMLLTLLNRKIFQ